MIYVEGFVVKSKRDNNIINIQDLTVLATYMIQQYVTGRNKQESEAQRLVAGVDVDYLNIPCKNERNINFVNQNE